MKQSNLLFMSAAMMLASCGGTKDAGQNGALIEKSDIKIEGKRMTPEALWAMGRIGSVAVSPDETQIAYSVAYYSVPENKSNNELFVMNADGNNNKQITRDNWQESQPAWIKEGKKIAFLCNESGSSQVWEMNPDGTERKQLTQYDGDIEGFSFSPDGKKLLFIAQVKTVQSTADKHSDLPKATGIIITDLMYKHWDEWVTTAPHPFVSEFDGNGISNVRDILEGLPYESPMKPFGGIEQLAWSPTSDKVAFTCRMKTGLAYAISTDSDIYEYDVQKGGFINLCKKDAKASNGQAEMAGYDTNPQYSPDGKYIAWQDVFDADGNYVLTDEVNAIYAKAASERKRMDSDLLKLDESVNIVYRIMQHQLLPLFPDENDAQGKWYSAGDEQTVFHDKDSLFVSKIMDWYIYELGNGVRTNNWKEADKIVDMMHIFQQAKSKTPAIDNQRVKAELLYNQLNLFFWCRLAYLILGGILLFIACGEIIADFKWGSRLSSILIVLLIAAFLAHTTGVLLRWYISERAPWANAYESMICTSWLLVGGGLLFARRFRILPALAGLLGGIMLFVAGLNHLNPEITPLVPVLQSYWLMSHVAIIMIGYVFFALCALTGLFNLILMNLLSATNRVKLLFRIREFTLLNEMAMILGLFFMTAGTFLGAIWANVSWGRYWGWDPKETWALISIVVYALVLHIRFIPLLKGKTTWCFNLLSVVSILSIIMTWFGVNYYLSGLHSYGKTEGGDLLLWIWGAGLCVVLALALFARRRLKKYS